MAIRHSKIVCTIGPSSCTSRVIDQLLRAGMDAARLNFSHGDHQGHTRSMALLRTCASEQRKSLAILADLQGPKIRTGSLADGSPVLLREGARFVITTKRISGDSTRVGTAFQQLPQEVRRGDRILLSDGLIELRVEKVRESEVICVVANGGLLGEHKGINLPGVKLTVPALTRKDREDLAFALKSGVNYIAVSFVRRPEDVLLAQSLVRRAGKDTPVFAKLEKPEAIQNLDEILRVADGVMVARGDLGVEMSLEQVPVIQKMIIARAREFGRPVITATQMLESMTEHPRPTRAEASDVANAVFDGSDAVMLSAETAIGKYPVESVAMMASIIQAAETSLHEFPRPTSRRHFRVAETIAELACHASRELRTKLIALFTHSGLTAALVSRYRPHVPIIAFAPDPETRNRLALIWGVLPREISNIQKIDSLPAIAEIRLHEERLVRKGDVIVLVSGTPMGIRSTANIIKLHIIGEPN